MVYILDHYILRSAELALTKNAQLHKWGTDKHPMFTRSTSGSGSGNASTGGRRVKVLGPIDCVTLSYIVKACNVQQLKQIRCIFLQLEWT